MKKNLAITFIFFLFASISLMAGNGTSLSCSELPQRPVVQQPVNDFANSIPEQVETQLQEKLTAYWKRTSITVALITVPSLGGNDIGDFTIGTFNCWGIGDKTNRGVLLLIAPNERKVFISPGYNLEGLLTDALVKRIIETKIIPNFKAGNPDNAVIQGIDGILSVLGTMSPEEKQQGERLKEEISEKEKQTQKQNLNDIFFYGGWLLILVVLLYAILRFFEKIKIRKKAKELHLEVKNEVQEGLKLLEISINQYDDEPSWAKIEAFEHAENCSNAFEVATKLLSTSQSLLKKDPEEAMAHAIEADKDVEKAFQNFKKIHVNIKAKIKKFSENAPTFLRDATLFLKEKEGVLTKYQLEGYGFDQEYNQLVSISKQLDDMKKLLAEKENHKNICERSTLLVQQAGELCKAVVQIVENKKFVDSNLANIQIGAKKILDEQDDLETIIGGLKSKYSKSVWELLEVSFRELVRKVQSEKIERSISSIRSDNSVDVKKFAQAFSDHSSLMNIISSGHALCKSIHTVKLEQEKAEKSYPEVLKKAKQAVEKALKIIKDGDVGASAKELAKSSALELQQITASNGVALLDWVLLVSLLYLCLKKAEQAIDKANADIEYAARKRREAAALAAAALAAARRREESSRSYASSTSFSTFSSGSSGGGFGGFGGGLSGGAGAGGSW